jgi:DNA-binding transcriptional MerR regulator
VKILDIAEVARRSGTPAATLRFYEEKKLIASDGRRNLRRTYGPDIFERLALVSLGRAAGFSLDEIAKMLTGPRPKIDKKRLAAKAEELDALIARLSAMRKGLRHALTCTAPDFMSCPHFRRVLKAAQKKKFEPAPFKPGCG